MNFSLESCNQKWVEIWILYFMLPVVSFIFWLSAVWIWLWTCPEAVLWICSSCLCILIYVCMFLLYELCVFYCMCWYRCVCVYCVSCVSVSNKGLCSLLVEQYRKHHMGNELGTLQKSLTDFYKGLYHWQKLISADPENKHCSSTSNHK